MRALALIALAAAALAAPQPALAQPADLVAAVAAPGRSEATASVFDEAIRGRTDRFTFKFRKPR